MSEPLLAISPEIAPFAAAVLARPDLHARLGTHTIPEDFIVAALELAAELGVALDPAAMNRAIGPDPLGLARWDAAPVTLGHLPQGDWLPIASVAQSSPPQFDWAWFGDDLLRAPFYQDDARWAASLPFNRLFRTRTDLPAIIEGTGIASAVEAAPLSLAGLVFHMSRCGSTLLAQMLGALDAHLVLSEPEPLDAVLLWAWREQVPVAQAVPALRAIVAALGRPRGTTAQRLFIKLDAWHILSLPLLREAFPEIPWVYLFREPVEVLVSHRREAGMHTVAGLMPEALFGIEGGQSLPPLDYAARTLEAIGDAALSGLAQGRGLAVNYPAIPAAAPTAIAAHFGLTLARAEQAAMDRAARADAKAPEHAFVPDTEDKRASANSAIRAAAVRLVPIHARLLAAAHGNS